MRTSPIAFGVTTMGANQSVGSSTPEITFMVNILSISALVLSNNGNGTFLGTCKANGWALSLKPRLQVQFFPRDGNAISRNYCIAVASKNFCV